MAFIQKNYVDPGKIPTGITLPYNYLHAAFGWANGTDATAVVRQMTPVKPGMANQFNSSNYIVGAPQSTGEHVMCAALSYPLLANWTTVAGDFYRILNAASGARTPGVTYFQHPSAIWNTNALGVIIQQLSLNLGANFSNTAGMRTCAQTLNLNFPSTGYVSQKGSRLVWIWAVFRNIENNPDSYSSCIGGGAGADAPYVDNVALGTNAIWMETNTTNEIKYDIPRSRTGGSRRHRGGEMWNIMPEVSGYL